MNHIRIDEGVKRGPRRKDAPQRANLRPYRQENSQAIAVQHRATIIQALAFGRMLKDIAEQFGVDPSAISHYLANDPEYKQARESGIAAQLDQWQEYMETADSPLNLARGREIFRAVAWRGEREFPHRWGQKQEINHTVAPVLHIHAHPQERVVSDAQHVLVESKT